MFPFLLYIVTGVATGYQAFWIVMWAVWGRQPHPLEFVSLIGSLALIGAAVVSLFKPRPAAWVALFATLISWTYYGPALVQTSVQIASDRELILKFIRWTPGPERLPVRESSMFRLTPEERTQLEAIGLTGQLAVVGRGGAGRGKRSSAIIVMKHQVDSTVELPQPDGTQVIYVQGEKNWSMYPSNAPTLRRKIYLEVASHANVYTVYWLDLASGGRSGGTAFNWSEFGRSRDP